MKEVAFLICSNTTGGHEFQSMELVRSAKKYCRTTVIFNNETHLALLKNDDDITKIVRKNFFKGGNFFLQFIYGIINIFTLRHHLKKYDKVIVCAGTIEAGISSGVCLIGMRPVIYVPMYVDREVLWGKVGCIYNFISYLFTVPYSAIITINRIQAKFFLKRKKVFIIPNKIEASDLIESSSHLFEGNKRLYFVGRLEDQKRISELITWLDFPANRYKEIIIIGNGSERERIEHTSNDLKHIEVKLYGWKNKVEQEAFFTKNDTFVINSAYEGDPLVIREANKRGSIVIARNIAGVKECTYKSNRFNNQAELVTLLNLAYDGKLAVFENPSEKHIEVVRDNVIREIFV